MGVCHSEHKKKSSGAIIVLPQTKETPFLKSLNKNELYLKRKKMLQLRNRNKLREKI